MCYCASCVRIGAGHFPIILMLMMVVTLAATYTLAVYRRDVDPYFPYISDTGGKKPESCVFGLLLNTAAFLGVIIAYLRYRLVKELNRESDHRLDRVNRIALIVAFISSFGMVIVANFQVTAVFVIHLTGAFICFGAGLIYSLLQTVASYRMYPLYNGITICRIRFMISLTALAAFLTCIITGSLAVSINRRHKAWINGDIWHLHDLFVINKNDPAYFLHITSAASEWILAMALLIFLITYSRDFEKLRVTVAVEPLVTHLDESPPTGPLLEAQNLLVSV